MAVQNKGSVLDFVSFMSLSSSIFLLRMNLELFSAVIANSFKRSVRAPFDPTPKLEAQNALDHFEQIPNSLMGMDEIDL